MLAFREELTDGLMPQVTQEVSNYVSTFIALAVAAIGFSINLSLDLKMNILQAPLIIAVVCWGISLVVAFFAIQQKFVMFTHVLELMDFSRKISSRLNREYDTEEKKQQSLKEVKDLWEKSKPEAASLEIAIQKLESLVEYNRYAFIAGVIFFVGWWILKLINNTSPLV